VALVNSTADTLRKPRLRERTHRAWLSRILRHPARKRSGSILTTPEPYGCKLNLFVCVYFLYLVTYWWFGRPS